MSVNAPALEADFKRFAAGPDDPIAGALLVSRLVDPATDVAWCHRELGRLAAAVARPGSPVGVIEALRIEGFAGAEDYYEARNSALQFVLQARRGIPISLAMVVAGVGARSGLVARGINFPGHFLVMLGEQLVDPFTLEIIDDDERDQRIEACGVPAQVALRPANAADIVLRMLNNLRGLAAAQGNHAQALEYTDYQLLLTHETYALRMIRADLAQPRRPADGGSGAQSRARRRP